MSMTISFGAPAAAVYVTTPEVIVFPLQLSSNHRYLIGQNNQPFRIQSDAVWLMSVRADSADIDTYIADRQARGFNTFILMNMVHQGAGSWTNGSEPQNSFGENPFNTTGNFSTPNDAYFDFIEEIIDKAAAAGMLVLWFYTYLGYGGGNDGWWSEVNSGSNTQSVCFAWGQYLGTRFGAKQNLILMVAGDYDIPVDGSTPSGEGRTRVRQILLGLRDAGAEQLAGSEWGPFDTLVTDQAGFTYGPDLSYDMQLNTFYGHGPGQNGQTFTTAREAWTNTPTLPAWIQEPIYENNAFSPIASDAPAMRRMAYWAITSGGTAGSCFGTENVWQFYASWESSLNSEGSQSKQHEFALFQSLPWWEMVPDGTASGFLGRELVVSNKGSGNTTITACATATGTWLLAYVPSDGGTSTRSFSIDCRSQSGSSRARWFNPTTGVYTDITGGSYSIANSDGSHAFTTPGDNGESENDWMLVLDTGA